MSNILITTLNDDETWSETVGTHVYVLSPSQAEWVSISNLSPDDCHTMKFDLTNPAHLRSLALYLENNR